MKTSVFIKKIFLLKQKKKKKKKKKENQLLPISKAEVFVIWFSVVKMIEVSSMNNYLELCGSPDDEHTSCGSLLEKKVACACSKRCQSYNKQVILKWKCQPITVQSFFYKDKFLACIIKK